MKKKLSKDLPQSCLDHHSNGHTEDTYYTIFTSLSPAIFRNHFCTMTAAPWNVRLRYFPIPVQGVQGGPKK